MTIQNNDSTIAKCTKRQAAVKKYVPATGTITVRGRQYTQQQLLAAYQASIDTRATLVTLRAQASAGMVARKQADTAMTAVDSDLQSWVDTTAGIGSQEATDFGYTKKAPVPRTAAEKAASAAKAKATKEARGEIGKKARSKITAPAAATSTAASPPANAVASPPPTTSKS